MGRPWGLAARATVALGASKDAASGADDSGAPRPRSSSRGGGVQRTLSRLLCLAALGSVSGAATAEEHLEHLPDGLALARGDARLDIASPEMMEGARSLMGG
jgi:hypothetical protein